MYGYICGGMMCVIYNKDGGIRGLVRSRGVREVDSRQDQERVTVGLGEMGL